MPLKPTLPASGPDFADSKNLADALMRQADELQRMAPDVAKARTILEFSSDRRKIALGAAFKRAREVGATSATEAEHYARSSAEYQTTLAKLESDHEAAEAVIQRHRAAESKFEAIRSALSLQKTITATV